MFGVLSLADRWVQYLPPRCGLCHGLREISDSLAVKCFLMFTCYELTFGAPECSAQRCKKQQEWINWVRRGIINCWAERCKKKKHRAERSKKVSFYFKHIFQAIVCVFISAVSLLLWNLVTYWSKMTCFIIFSWGIVSIFPYLWRKDPIENIWKGEGD